METLTHTATMNLWNVETDREQRTEVRTFWFDVERDAVRQRANVAQHRGNPGLAAGNRAVDPLARQQHRAL